VNFTGRPRLYRGFLSPQRNAEHLVDRPKAPGDVFDENSKLKTFVILSKVDE